MIVSCLITFECQYLMILVKLNVFVNDHKLFACNFDIFKVTEVNFTYYNISTYCLVDVVIYSDNI